MHENSRSFLYGFGVFSTIRIMNGELFLWEKHWRRLGANAAKLGIDVAAYSEENVKQQIKEIIAKENILSGKARITFADDSPSDIWPVDAKKKTTLQIISGDLQPVSDNLRLTISPYIANSGSPLAGIKSCNYLEKILALDEARARGFDEAIQINERGEVTSGTMANLFWIKGEVLFTPSLKTGCLPGTTREFVMENLECREVEVMLDELDAADAIFLTSAGLGVVEVAEFASRRFDRLDHPIVDLLPSAI